MALNDDKRALFALTKKHGFSLHRESKHYIFKHSSGKILVAAKTVSDRRALKNVERDIKRVLAS